MSQLVNAEVNSGNCKEVSPSNYATRIRGRNNQLNYTRTLIPSVTRSNGKVDVCVLLVVLRGCQSTKKRSTFLPRTSVIFFVHV